VLVVDHFRGGPRGRSYSPAGPPRDPSFGAADRRAAHGISARTHTAQASRLRYASETTTATTPGKLDNVSTTVVAVAIGPGDASLNPHCRPAYRRADSGGAAREGRLAR
jgi:hypothetical protein